MPHANRENNFSKFYDWLKSQGVDTGCVEITNFDDVGYGLKAMRDLKVYIIEVCFYFLKLRFEWHTAEA